MSTDRVERAFDVLITVGKELLKLWFLIPVLYFGYYILFK